MFICLYQKNTSIQKKQIEIILTYIWMHIHILYTYIIPAKNLGNKKVYIMVTPTDHFKI